MLKNHLSGVAFFKVTNIPNTSDRTCPCGTWISHWENFSGTEGEMCSAVGCVERNVLGAHVRKVGAEDRNEYIIPFCDSHNKRNDEILVRNATVFISANKNLTCET